MPESHRLPDIHASLLTILRFGDIRQGEGCEPGYRPRVRLTFLARAESAGTRDLVLGDTSDVVADAGVAPWPTRKDCFAGPETACITTAGLLGLGDPVVVPGLRGPDLSDWAGRALADVGETDPNGLRAWLADPHAAPHGGESLTDLLERIGRVLEDHPWPKGGAVAVVDGFVVRAALTHALTAPAGAMLRTDVPPLGRVTITRHGGRWRLSGLSTHRG